MESLEMNQSCLLCNSNSWQSILRVKQTPQSSQRIYQTKQNARRCARANLDIVICKKCSLIFNQDYFKGRPKPKARYRNNDYYSSVSHLGSSKEYQKRLVNRISDYIDLKKSNILEIGCGDGFFLKELGRYCSQAIGFEPAKTYNLAKAYKGLLLFNEYFHPDKTCFNQQVDLFILRHVLEHLENPYLFLKRLKGLFNFAQSKQYLFIEVPNAAFLLAQRMYFDFYYDHIYYFTDLSLLHLLQSAGWTDIEWIDTDGEFLTALCSSNKRETKPSIKAAERSMVNRYRELAQDFWQEYSRWRRKLEQVLLSLVKEKQKIAAWGCGARGISLISNLSGEKGLFSYVVDSDPHKRRLYLPISGLQIFTPDRIRKHPPDFVLITAFTYFDEICACLRPYRKNGLKVLRVYPEITII